jgi:hypothetical protein
MVAKGENGQKKLSFVPYHYARAHKGAIERTALEPKAYDQERMPR